MAPRKPLETNVPLAGRLRSFCFSTCIPYILVARSSSIWSRAKTVTTDSKCIPPCPLSLLVSISRDLLLFCLQSMVSNMIMPRMDYRRLQSTADVSQDSLFDDDANIDSYDVLDEVINETLSLPMPSIGKAIAVFHSLRDVTFWEVTRPLGNIYISFRFAA